MKLIVTEKNQTAQRISQVLSEGKAEREGSSRTPIYTFSENGEEVKCIGLRGHIMKVDFPDSYRDWQGVEPRELVDAEILKVPTLKTLIKTLQGLGRKADKVIIATDFDREGELIGYDALNKIVEVNPDVSVARARFSSLTPAEIKKAFSSLDVLLVPLAEAGEARQDVDLIWGASLTRFISLATTRLGNRFLSVGRVQSPTLALVVAKEREIQDFKPETYWQIQVTLSHEEEQFAARHKQERFLEEREAQQAFSRLGQEGVVAGVQQKERKLSPPAPFNTTSFLAAASALKVSPARAMNIAEGLYTRGLMSYPRVDNTVYPSNLDLRGILNTLTEAEVVGKLAAELLKKEKLTPTRGKKRATDHPPIHPTGVADKTKLSGPEWKIYELVARRFMATLAEKGHARSTRVDIDITGEPFVARGDVILDEGYLKFYHYTRKKDEELPELKEGDKVEVVDRDLQEKQTQPPPRYSEGKLIVKMEELGLGTKSTRHAIIQNLKERGYAFGSPLKASETGMAVASTLGKHAEMVTTPDMTSELEREMDAIVEGEASKDEVVNRSREMLAQIIKTMESEKDAIAKEIREGIRGDITLGSCPSCGKELRVRRAGKSRKRFVGCQGYPECTNTYPLPQKGKIVVVGETCSECETPKIKVITKGRRPWELCLDPECPTKSK